MIVGVLAAIGAINWGLVGLANIDLVARLFGAGSSASRVVYGLIGVSGLLLLVGGVFKLCPCQKGACATK
jgi:uncharacterized membrane protein YuzA (DUF378 family)